MGRITNEGMILLIRVFNIYTIPSKVYIYDTFEGTFVSFERTKNFDDHAPSVRSMHSAIPSLRPRSKTGIDGIFSIF